MNSSLLSSKKQDWCTPKEFFDVLDAEFHFTLDAEKREVFCVFHARRRRAEKKVGGRAALYSAIRHTDGKCGNGCARRTKNRETDRW